MDMKCALDVASEAPCKPSGFELTSGRGESGDRRQERRTSSEVQGERDSSDAQSQSSDSGPRWHNRRLICGGPPERWVPAIRVQTHSRYCIPRLGTGEGCGLVHTSWDTDCLTNLEQRWARVLKAAPSEAEFQEGVHFEYDGFHPRSVHFVASDTGSTIRGLRSDTAASAMADLIQLNSLLLPLETIRTGANQESHGGMGEDSPPKTPPTPPMVLR